MIDRIPPEHWTFGGQQDVRLWRELQIIEQENVRRSSTLFALGCRDVGQLDG